MGNLSVVDSGEVLVGSFVRAHRERSACEIVLKGFRKGVIDLLRRASRRYVDREGGWGATLTLGESGRRTFLSPIETKDALGISHTTLIRMCQLSAKGVDAAVTAGLITKAQASQIEVAPEGEPDPYDGLVINVKYDK